ncbi:hypothetical protein [Marinoscillum sp. MHG1-6]|uniref:hypothetical protein n=1 Tax=Marinoscillum sp. MHG1-6 TaxID=2959627 RepID=UPI0021583753|nr:hypothetical protein [Marinoscillum sp. MHG1-6]
MRKKKVQDEYQEEGMDVPQQTRNRPKTFEELLREFTDEQSEEHKETMLDEFAEDQRNEPDPVTEPETHKPGERDRSKRTFADDESKRVYEESIKMAEGSDIQFERDSHFTSGIKRREDPEEEENPIGKEILAALQNPNEAKKAVVLSEILNRKY